jgi:fibronectin type 3 domain-containing protein
MQVVLTWNSVPNALYYNVYRGTLTGGPYNLIAQSNPNPGMSAASGGIVTTFTDGPGNLVNGQTYYYRISAVTVDGESAYSTPQTTATAPAQPSAPGGVAAVVT